jgi:hypothetical protein
LRKIAALTRWRKLRRCSRSFIQGSIHRQVAVQLLHRGNKRLRKGSLRSRVTDNLVQRVEDIRKRVSNIRQNPCRGDRAENKNRTWAVSNLERRLSAGRRRGRRRRRSPFLNLATPGLRGCSPKTRGACTAPGRCSTGAAHRPQHW